jgi:hypothetical protein
MIVVASYKGSPFLQSCLDSIPADIPCFVVRCGGYECGALRIAQKMDTDEFFFMQDSARIKDPQWLYDILADKGQSYSVNNETGLMSMFTGKYRMEILKQIILPDTKTKFDAVLAEMKVGQVYANLDPQTKVLWPELRLENARQERIFDREVMIYENDHFWKAKGCWGGWMLEEVQARDERTRAA